MDAAHYFLTVWLTSVFRLAVFTDIPCTVAMVGEGQVWTVGTAVKDFLCLMGVVVISFLSDRVCERVLGGHNYEGIHIAWYSRRPL